VTASNCTVLHFSTGKLAPSQRLPAWYEIFCHTTSRRYCSPIADTCQVDMQTWALSANDTAAAAPADVRIQRVAVTHGLQSQRTRQLLADGNDDLVLNIQQAGDTCVSQCGRQSTAPVGTAILTSNADVSTISFPASTRFTSIALPRRLMSTLAPGAEDALARPTQLNAPVVPMLLNYLDLVVAREALQAPELRRIATTHIQDLCALAIGASRDAVEIAKGRGLRAARLLALKADIAANLTNGRLSADVLAKRHRMTARYVHRLFESEGVTLSHFVRAARLARVYRNLANPQYAGHTIGALAFEAGFTDLSTFNREFRRHYGMTPSDLRAASMRGET
jgi:AraC-like DNA-binding protein